MLDSTSEKPEPNLAPPLSAVVKTEPEDTTHASAIATTGSSPCAPPQVAKTEATEAPVQPSHEQVAVASADAPLQPPVHNITTAITTTNQANTSGAQSDAVVSPTLPVGENADVEGETSINPQDAKNQQEAVPHANVSLPAQKTVQVTAPAPAPAPSAAVPTIPNEGSETLLVTSPTPATAVKTEPGPETSPVPPQAHTVSPAPLLSAPATNTSPVKTEGASIPPVEPQQVAPPPATAPPPVSKPANPVPPPPSNSRGPPPRNLPKSCKNRPKNSRVFVGNLASEFTNPTEMIAIFHKYGDLIEEPVLRRSFGFIQYGNPQAALRAVAGEQAKIIGGIPIDLSIADNREVKRGTHLVNNTPFPHGGKGRQYQHRNMRHHNNNNNYGHNNNYHHNNHNNHRNDNNNSMSDHMGSRKRRRSVSPGGGNVRRMGGVHPPQFRRQRPEPRNGIHMRILCMSATAKNYSRQCEALFRNDTGLGCDIVQIVAAGLGEGLGKCMQQNIPYVVVVASKDVEDGTCTIRTLERTGYEKAGRGNGVISLREAIDVCLIDRGITPRHGNMNMNNNMNNMPAQGQQFGMHNQNPYGPPQQQVQMVQAGWGQQPGAGPMQGGNSYQNNRKPGWMSGPRAPPHPQNVGLLRGGPPGMDNNNNTPNGYTNPSPIGAHQMPMPGRPPYPQPYNNNNMNLQNMAPPPVAPAPIPEYQGAPPQQVGWPGAPGGYGAPPPPPPPQHQYTGNVNGNHNRNGGNEYDPMAAASGQPAPQEYGRWVGQQSMNMGGAPVGINGNSNPRVGQYNSSAYQVPPQGYSSNGANSYQQRPPPPYSNNAGGNGGAQGHGNTYPAYNDNQQQGGIWNSNNSTNTGNNNNQHTGGGNNNNGNNSGNANGTNNNNNNTTMPPNVDFDKLSNLVSLFQQNRNDVGPGRGNNNSNNNNAPLLSQQPYGNSLNRSNSNNNNNSNNIPYGTGYPQYQQQSSAQGQQARNYSRR